MIINIDRFRYDASVKTLPLVACYALLAQPTLAEDEAVALERVFRALADRARLRIVNVLAAAAEPVCVCELVPALGLAQPTVSYHLKQLAEAGLVERERRGTFAYYRLADGALDRLAGVFEPVAA